MAKQLVEIKLTSVTIELGRHVVCTYQEGWQGEVSGAEDIRQRICDQVKEVIKKFTQHLENYLTAEVTLKGGTKLTVAVMVNLQGTYCPEITNNSIKTSLGKEVPIRFGSTLHNTLYNIANGSRLSTTKSVVSLHALDLVGCRGEVITPKGLTVLKQLSKLGPPTNKRGLLLVAQELLHTNDGKDTVTRNYLIDKKYITHGLSIGFYVCTDLGTQWLQTYAHRIYNYKLPPNFSHTQLIPFMSKGQLTDPLTSTSELDRIKAAQRMQELGGEPPPSIDITSVAIDSAAIKRLWKELGFA